MRSSRTVEEQRRELMVSAADETMTGRTWVAFGPVGAVGSIHETADGFSFKLLSDPGYHGQFATLDAAKGALHAALKPGSDWPEFKEH